MNEENGVKDALKSCIDSLEKTYGKGVVMYGDSNFIEEVQSISTGSIGLDMALGIGGLPRGRIIEIYGQEASGKTSLCLHVIAQAQKMGLRCLYIDIEQAMDNSYAEKLGVNTRSDLYLFAQPSSGEEALEICEKFALSRAVDVIVIDSVAALVPKADIDAIMGSSQPGSQARLMSMGLRRINPIIGRNNVMLIFINQLRMKIGVAYGNPEITSGGTSLKYYASVRIEVKRASSLKQGEEIIGSTVRAKITKNKLAPPHKQAEFDIYFGEGISKTSEIIDLGSKFSIINKSGSWYSYKEHKLGQGKDKAKEFLVKNPQIMKEVEDELKTKSLDLNSINSIPIKEDNNPDINDAEYSQPY